ncbi:Ig-like domain-containing protein [Ruegeria arenilitoris]|uniref:Ig-like domain-containing protein n=1 Tax=Ruegeria arenilitoris TaxID=1173585 RepID=UPI00147AD41E|nr:Ig-like domain-containing protein [Ruegeria arenilitoris]
MGRSKKGSSGQDVPQSQNDSGILAGGKSDDLYVIDLEGVFVSERRNGGHDTVEASVNFTLSSNVEDLILVGTEDLTATGNELDNLISGNGGNNKLFGLGGNDTLSGGAGNDLIDGGDGIDTALYGGSIAEYLFEQADDGFWVYRDTQDGEIERDYLIGIEALSFEDGDVLVDDLFPVNNDEDLFPHPIANDDTISISEDQSITIDVLQNDGGTALIISSLSQGNLGEVNIQADGSIVYQPFANVFGEDRFTYTVLDMYGRAATATVTVNITAVNDAPEAHGDFFEVLASGVFESSLSVLLNDFDPDGDILYIESFDGVTANGGTVSINENGYFTYITPDFYDETSETTDSFSYVVVDSAGETSTATVTLNIAASAPDNISQPIEGPEAPSYVLDALLPDGSSDTNLRWNDDQEIGSAVTITYSFLSLLPDYYGSGSPESEGFAPLSDAQIAAVLEILDHIEEFTNITFVEESESVGDLAFGTASLTYGSAWAYLPTGTERAGDVWINNAVSSNEIVSPGSNGYLTLMHEIGHALGLEHPHEGTALPLAEMNHQYSVMSYSEHSGMGGIEPSTYMLYDIVALQHLYGANSETAVADSTYNVSNLNDTLMTIWDAGGWDSLDASSSSNSVYLDLNSGSFSTAGTAYGWYPVSNNISIAYGTIIEQAIGGFGDDHLIGNESDNVLVGGAGNDVLQGGLGNDIFVFSTRDGSDNILDFEDGFDLIDLSDTALSLSELSLRDTSDGTELSFESTTLFLDGIASSQLTVSDFIFADIA